jgi:hypothetical protein
LDRKAWLDYDYPRGWIVRGDEHRRDHQVLARRQRAEVDKRRLQRVRGAKRAVVRLLNRAGAVGVCEQSTGLVERIGVRIVERRRDCQCCGP